MLTIRLKSFVTSERFIVTSVILILLSATLIAIINASNSNAHQRINITTSGNTVGDKESSTESVFEKDDENPLPLEEDSVIPKEVIEYETAEPVNATVSAKTIADDLLHRLQARIGTGRGPVIVGGIGDSGTRGVRDVLIHLGTQMLGEGYVNPISKDSQVYMDQYVTITTKGHRWLRSPPGLYNMAIRKAHSLKYNATSTNFDHWNCGRQYVAKMVDRSMSISMRFRGKNATLDPWGFKHPRTALLVPFWLHSLGNKFVFIHVLRDGKDIIEGDNQKVFRNACAKYYGRKCTDNLQQKINFWADLNRDVFEYALESGMKADQYYAVRIEDLVLGNEPCYRRLAHYLKLTPAEIAGRVPKAIAANRGHESSYLGHKWTADLKRHVESVMVHNNHTIPDFAFWGYRPDDYVLDKDCESLDWLKRMRAKKGPLPGDEPAGGAP